MLYGMRKPDLRKVRCDNTNDSTCANPVCTGLAIKNSGSGKFPQFIEHEIPVSYWPPVYISVVCVAPFRKDRSASADLFLNLRG